MSARWNPAWWLGVIVIVCFPAAARAQMTWQSSLAISSNATDNIRPPGAVQAEAGFFTTISPRFRLALERTSSVFALEYRFGVDLFANHLDSTAYVNALRLQSFFRLSDALRLTIGVEGSQGKQSSLLLSGNPSVTPIGVQPPGGALFIGGTGFERIDWDFSTVWTTYEDVQVTMFRPIDSNTQAASLIVGSEFGLERRWTADSLAGVLQPTFFIVSYPITAILQSQMITSLLARWRHDFGYFVTGEAAAGVMVAVNLDDPSSRAWGPTGRLGVHYQREEGFVDLEVAHTAQANALMGRTYLVEEVRLRGGIPIVRDSLAASASTGYQYGHALLSQGSEGAIHVVLADAALEWQATAYMGVSGRYQFARQVGDDPSFIAFSRHVGLFTLTFVYPLEGESQPIRVPSGRSYRVDRSDGDVSSEVRGGARAR